MMARNAGMLWRSLLMTVESSIFTPLNLNECYGDITLRVAFGLFRVAFPNGLLDVRLTVSRCDPMRRLRRILVE